MSWRAALVRRRGVEQGWTHFFRVLRAAPCPRRAAEILVLGRDALHLSETAFYPPRNRPSAPNRFASRHLYQFQERSCCPPIPIGRFAAGYRGAINKSGLSRWCVPSCAVSCAFELFDFVSSCLRLCVHTFNMCGDLRLSCFVVCSRVSCPGLRFPLYSLLAS